MSSKDSHDEELYLVDEDDREVGSIPKSQAHGDPSKIHREVGIVIVDKQKRILFQQRSFNKHIHAGAWALTAAGHVPYGDSYEQAAHMELKEEVGFDVPLKQFDKVFLEDPSERRFMSMFIGKYSGDLIRIQKSEVEQARFMSRQEFEELSASGIEITPLTKEIARKVWLGKLDSYLN